VRGRPLSAAELEDAISVRLESDTVEGA